MSTALRANGRLVQPSRSTQPTRLCFSIASCPYALSFVLDRFSTWAIFSDAVPAIGTKPTEGRTEVLPFHLHNPTETSGPRFASLHLKHHRSAGLRPEQDIHNGNIYNSRGEREQWVGHTCHHGRRRYRKWIRERFRHRAPSTSRADHARRL